MRTIIETKEVYNYDDLLRPENLALKQKIVNNWEYNDFWSSERYASYIEAEKIYKRLKELDTLTGIRLYKWLINNIVNDFDEFIYFSKHSNGTYKKSYFEYKYNCSKFRRSKIMKVSTLENCPLTGVCYDFDFLEPIIDFIKKPDMYTSSYDLCSLMPSYDTISNRDYEYYTSEDAILENIQDNDYEFTSDGKIY